MVDTRTQVLDQLTRERDEWRRELCASVAGLTRTTRAWQTEARSQIVKLGRQIRAIEGKR